MHETPIILPLSEKEVQQIVEVPSCCLGRPLQLLTPGDKKRSYATARYTNGRAAPHQKNFAPDIESAACGRTDRQTHVLSHRANTCLLNFCPCC